VAALQRTRSRRSRSALRAALAEQARAQNQRQQRERLQDELAASLVDLPYVFTEQLGPAELEALADELGAQLPAALRAAR